MKITVVTPSYNQAGYLEQTMRSVLDQKYPGLEYMVVDGGSTDASSAIIERYSNHLAWWCCEKDGGQSDAIAKGFARSTGDILCWLNSDDILLPGSLRKVAAYFEEHPSCEVVNGGAYVIDEHGRPSTKAYGAFTLGVEASYNRLRFFGQEGIFQQAVFWRRSAYESIGGLNRDLQFIMDLDLFTRLAKRQDFHRLPELLACFRLHGGSKSSRIQHVRTQELKHFAELHLGQLQGTPVSKAMYWFYRNKNRVRKLYLAGLLRAGAVHLDPQPCGMADSLAEVGAQ